MCSTETEFHPSDEGPVPDRADRGGPVEGLRAFEAAWLAGANPRIEDYIGGLSEPERSRRLRALLETELGLLGQGAPSLRTYLDRFPDDPEVVEEVHLSTVSYAGATQADDAKGRGPSVRAVGEEIPRSIGPYQVLRLLGKGTFGAVYLAEDANRGLTVAIKVPRSGSFRSASQVGAFRDEARAIAGLDHPSIVKVHETGPFGDAGLYVVMEFIEGSDLAQVLRDRRLPLRGVVGLLAVVADALNHAHVRGLVHRDLKPANILVGPDGLPRIVDFGLALHEDAQRLRAGEVAGTPAFMAPEQVRGEAHRLDGRTDIWALGAILYLALTGRKPFSGTQVEILDEILHREPKPPRQVVEDLPAELERICLKCLMKRMTDRYTTAADLAADLRHWLQTPDRPAAEAGSRPLRVIPRGLRSFDTEDADFFLDLIPGPRDRGGLPEIVGFWARRIGETEPSRTFRVGLIYGPSGSGKSSLVKAGLLPRLGPRVIPIYVEATPGDTESRVLEALRRAAPGLPQDRDLPGTVAAIRTALEPGLKVVLVLDQFEQWLHGRSAEPEGGLVLALRQCDGRHVQAVLLVRDDFWMAITGLMREVEVPLIEGRNMTAVELFDLAHARSVLARLGAAFGRLPDDLERTTPDQARFLDQAVAGLDGGDGRVIPVRLTLLAEMLRNRPWVPATLRSVGGTEGIGVLYLEETFSAATAPPTHRLHQRAARSVLKAMLPSGPEEIRGDRRTYRELLAASGYGDRPGHFDELIRVLDTELRLITPADPESAGEAGVDRDGKSYQLAHDYLVPLLRRWLTIKQRQTRRGRAELRLASQAAFYRDRPEPHRLPPLHEWVWDLAMTRFAAWSADERRLMAAAARHHLSRVTLALSLVAVVGFVVVAVRDRERAEALLERALKVDYRHLSELIPEIDLRRDRIDPALVELERDPATPDHDRRIAALLLYRENPTKGRSAVLRSWLQGGGPDEVALIRQALAAQADLAGVEALRGVALDEAADPARRLRATCAMASLGGAAVATTGPTPVALAQALLSEDRRAVPRWLELLGPAVPALVPSLRGICRDPGRDPAARATAADALAEALVQLGDPVGLARSVVESRPDAARVLLRELARLRPAGPALDYLRGVLAERSDLSDEEAGRDAVAARQAGAAIALAALGRADELWPLLRHRPDPRLRATLIDRLPRSGLPSLILQERLAAPAIDPIERQALLMTWAETDAAGVPAPARSAVLAAAEQLHATAPSPAVHSAAEQLLRRWGKSDRLDRPSSGVGGPERPPADRRWMFGPNGHTLVILPGPLEFRMGSPPREPGRFDYEDRHHRRIDRTIAVSTREVTHGQYRAFSLGHGQDPRYGEGDEIAATHVRWHDAVRYCNWLSKEAGIKPDQWCYEVEGETAAVSRQAVDRPGFRLPTEAEYKYFCRAGSETARPFGELTELLPRYAWTWRNSEDKIHPAGLLLPNEFGLFDVLGNLWEWCDDGVPSTVDYLYTPYPPGTADHPVPDPARTEAVRQAGTWRIIRGGAFNYGPDSARSAHRDIGLAGRLTPYIGFRVVRTLTSAEVKIP